MILPAYPWISHFSFHASSHYNYIASCQLEALTSKIAKNVSKNAIDMK